MILSETGRQQGALEQYYRIIELVPECPGSASGKAGVYSNMGELDEAVKWQRLAVKKDPGNVSRKVELASMYVDLGLTDLATATIDEISLQSPGFEGLIYVQAALDMYQGEYQQAVDRFDLARQKNPDEYSYWGNQVFYQMLLGQYAKVIEGYQQLYPGQNGQAFAIRLDNFDSTINYIWSLMQTGEEDQAKQLINDLEQLLAEYPEQNTDFRKAMIAALKGEYELSAQLFFGEYKRGASRGFWRGDHLPMLKPVLAHQISQEFGKLYDYELEQQRQAVLALVDI